MHTPWIGARKIAVLPVVVNDPQYDPPPANWADQIHRRLFYDPDPNSGVDRSLRTYIHTISYGKALLEADILEPVTVAPCDINAAIQACPNSHLYEYVCLVFTANTAGCGGWAFWDNPPFPFNPARSPNNLRHWCRVNMGEPLGIWAMEVMHMTTGFGDLYNTTPHPGNFDNMACSCGSHPSTFTKLKLGWLDPSWIATAGSYTRTVFTLHSLALLQPPPPGRVTAVRIPSSTSQRYFLLEARLRLDPYERITPGLSAGIPSEGVVIYEIDEATWPVQLRTPTALPSGQSYSNQIEKLQIEVTLPVPGGFTVAVQRSLTMELHVCGVTNDGNMWHTIRRADGSWFQFGDVKGVAGNPGSFLNIDCAGVSGQLHVCGITNDDNLWHTIRRADGSWFPFGDVKVATGFHRSKQFRSVATTEVADELHVCGTVRDIADWPLYHTVRRADGSWFPFGYVGGSFISGIDCSGVSGELHVCGIDSSGGLWHTIRRADGSWLPFGDVKGQAGDPGSFAIVGTAEVKGELHVCGQAGGDLWHTIRRVDGSWLPFGDVKSQAGNPGSFGYVSCVGVGDELHVCGNTTDGNLWHTIRRADGSWSMFGDVKGQTGDPGHFGFVSLAAP